MMRITSLLLLSPLLASAFTVQHAQPNHHVPLHMSTEAEAVDINLVINGNNIDLTPALNEYVEKRIGGPLRKLGGDGIVRECDVHLSVYKNPKVRQNRDCLRNYRIIALIYSRRESQNIYNIWSLRRKIDSKRFEHRIRITWNFWIYSKNFLSLSQNRSRMPTVST
jgi:ribosome-associated translation inhibitor RaiA